MTFRPGRRLGLDIGSVRIGVAACDPEGILATPAATVIRKYGDEIALDELVDLVEEYEPIEVVVGNPSSLDGKQRASAASALSFTLALAARLRIPVRRVDERFTTSQAHGMLRSAGKDSRARRHSVDAAAAVIILQTALDQEKTTSVPAGELVHDPQGP